MSSPAELAAVTVPRKLALRIWSACLDSQARRLRALAEGRPLRRPDRAPSPGKARGRHELADRLDRQCAILRFWIDTRRAVGTDLPAELVGLVAAYLHQHGPAAVELRRRFGPSLEGIESDDAIAIVGRILDARVEDSP